MDNFCIQVRTTSDFSAQTDADRLRHRIHLAITEHLQRRRSLIQHVVGEVFVTRYEVTADRVRLGFAARGQINGIPFDWEVHASRHPSRVYAAHGHAFGLGILVGLVIHAAATWFLDVGKPARAIDECFSECTASLRQRIDSFVGHSESLSSVAWQWIRTLRWIGGIGIVAALTCLIVAWRGPLSFWAGLVVGVPLGGLVFGIIHVIGLACMPTKFFLSDPRGQVALARSGTNSVFLLRVICILIALAFAVGLFIGVMAMTEGLRKGAPPAQ